MAMIEHGEGGVGTARPRGRPDYLSAGGVKQERLGADEAGWSMLAVDLSAVDFVDRSCPGALVGGLKAARAAGGELRLAALAEQAWVVLSLTTLDLMFRSYGSVEETGADD